MSEIEAFLSPNDEQEIVAAIKVAEKNTSGEIRVHIEHSTEKDPYERALEVFYLLEMNSTKDQNGVLIYVAVHDHKFAKFFLGSWTFRIGKAFHVLSQMLSLNLEVFSEFIRQFERELIN